MTDVADRIVGLYQNSAWDQGEPLYHASLDDAEYRALLAAYGFEVMAHVAENPACGRHTVWLARRV